MRYVSTRGQAAALSFKDALLAGLAGDGGLYVPEAWPQLSFDEIRSLRGKPYAEMAFAVMSPFVGGEIDDVDLRRMIEEAYATFHHPAVAPLVQMGPKDWLLELFHGPTLAFKDVAMQILARLMDHVLTERGERLTIVGRPLATQVARHLRRSRPATASTHFSCSPMARSLISSAGR